MQKAGAVKNDELNFKFKFPWDDEPPIDFMTSPEKAKVIPAVSEILMAALVDYEVKNTGNDSANAARSTARALGLDMKRYEVTLETARLLQSMNERRKRIEVSQGKDKTILVRALAALNIRNEITEDKKQRIMDLVIELGMDPDQFDTLCEELKVPDDPERSLEWRSKDGSSYKLSDMKDSHLLNAILFLERSAQLDFQGELLLTFALMNYKPTQREREALVYAAAQEKPDAPPMYWAMRREAQRRGLYLPPAKTKDEAPKEKVKPKAPATPGARAFNFEE